MSSSLIEVLKERALEPSAPTVPVLSTTPTPVGEGEQERSSRLVEVTLDLPTPADWLANLPLGGSTMVRVLICRPNGRKRPRMLRVLEVVAPPTELSDLTQELDRRVRGSSLALLPMGSNRLLVRMETPQTPVCAGSFRSGAYCLECPYFPSEPGSANGERRGSWVLPSAGVPTLMRALRGPGASPAPRVVRIGRYRERDRLTSRQDEALHLAHRMGFFEVPRKADLGALSQALGVSRATAMELVRRGLRSLTTRWSEGTGGPPTPPEL